MPRRPFNNVKRVSKAQWAAMSVAERLALKRALGQSSGKNYRTQYNSNSNPSVQYSRPSGMTTGYSLNTLTHTPLFPISKWGKLPYYDQNSFSTGALTAGGYVFSANGMFDPNITGVGHQPMGFDQMMLFYEHYTVTQAKITVNFYNTDADDSVIVGILIAPDATINTNFSALNENGMLVKRWLNNATGNSGNKTTLTIQADIAKINGRKDLIDDDIFRGDVAANPTEQSYIHLFAYNHVSVNVVTVAFEVTIEYVAKFTEPRKMTQS